MSRPEHLNPPDVFYNQQEAKKYASSNRMLEIQTKMAERALELLYLTPGPKIILDIGCGTGLSGKALEKAGHVWVGTDISRSMLDVGYTMRGASIGDAVCSDMGTGLPFRPGMFDGCISISALQWLCSSNSSDENPYRRVPRFFQSLYGCMARGSRCVFQFYPENSQQLELLTTAAMKTGFTGGVLVDYPNSAKAKKYFLVLFAGTLPGQIAQMPEAKTEQEVDGIRFENERKRTSRKTKEAKPQVKSKEWIQKKNERRVKQGKSAAHPSKYTGQQRKPKF